MMDERDNQHSLGYLMEVDVEPKADKADTSHVVCRRCQKTGHFPRKCTSQTLGSESRDSKSDVGARRGFRSDASMMVMPKPCHCCLKQHKFKSEQGKTLYKSCLRACWKFRDLSH